jgi:heme exporter protein A
MASAASPINRVARRNANYLSRKSHHTGTPQDGILSPWQSETDPMLEATDLECTRGDRCLFSGLNLRLDAGELLHVQGRNGSGKSTLLRALSGLFQPSAGEISWKGTSIDSLREEFGREVLYLGHKTGIKGDLSALENLHFAADLDGASITETQAWQALEQIGLRGFEDLPCKHLSQGQKLRVSLARLITSRAKLWVLDEPFSALDSGAVEDLQKLISQHIANSGMAILTTHQEVALTRGEIRQLMLGTKGNSHV